MEEARILGIPLETWRSTVLFRHYGWENGRARLETTRCAGEVAGRPSARTVFIGLDVLLEQKLVRSVESRRDVQEEIAVCTPSTYYEKLY